MSTTDYHSELPPEDLLRLIRSALAGDPRAQEEFAERFWPKLRPFLRSRIYRCTITEVDDLLSSFWLYLFDSESGRATLLKYVPRPESKFTSYLGPRLRGSARDVWRRERRAVQCDPAVFDAILSHETTPEQRLAADELVAIAGDLLSPRESKVWQLWILEGHDDAEIARRLNMTANNVYQVRNRIRKKLWDDFGPDEGAGAGARRRNPVTPKPGAQCKEQPQSPPGET